MKGPPAVTHRGCGPAAAITLFELLLVLVLLVVIGSLAAPLFEGSLSSIRLRRGTDQVLATWSQARNHAIEAGKIFQFRFQIAGSSYRVDPWQDELEFDLDSLADAKTMGASETASEEIELGSWTYEASLPAEIVFFSAQSVSQNAYGERSLRELTQEATTRWSAPVFFYPDGSTSAASLLLKSGKEMYRRATLRALTGVARASDLLSREEVERLQSP